MTVPTANRRYTIDEYLRLERDSRDKHEFHDGEILAMSGGTAAHSLISMNVGRALGGRSKGNRCRVYDSNLRVRIIGTEHYVYPDVTIICGPLEVDPADTKGETVMNVRVVVEVLSPSTEKYDRTTKFDWYRMIPSLQEYVLVSQDQPRVEVFRRQGDGSWAFASAVGTDTSIKLASVDVELALNDVFDGVDFPPAPIDPASSVQP